MGLGRIPVVLLAAFLAVVMYVVTFRLVTGTMFENGPRLGFILTGWLAGAGLVAWLWALADGQSRRGSK